MSASFRKPPEPKGEVRALFPEQAAGPFQSTGGDDTDLDFLRRFGPKDRPVDMRGFVEEPPEAAASALSAPDNFIADGATRRLVRHMFGRRRWPLVLIATALGGILALGAHRLGLVPFLRPAPERPAPEAARGAPAGDALATATHPPAPAPAKAARAAPAETEPSATAEEAAALARRIAAGGPIAGEGEAAASPKVTAFPPLQAAEPEPAANPPAAAAPAPNTKLDALVARGEQLLTAGEVAAARLFFRRAATEGDPRGARGLARSYDPSVLRTLPVVGLDGDRAEAERWYLKAAELEARRR